MLNGAMILYETANGGYENVIKILMATGADVDAETADETIALMIALERGYERVIVILLDADANVNS